MTGITAQRVNELRGTTGAPLMKCKMALIETNGDLIAAGRILRKMGESVSSPIRATGNQGFIAVYSHPGNQVVSLVELACDTDFVARSISFQTLAKELAMQVAATVPIALTPEDLPENVREDDRNIADHCLLTQESVRYPNQTVRSLVADLRLQVRENIYVRRFARWQVGENLSNL